MRRLSGGVIGLSCAAALAQGAPGNGSVTMYGVMDAASEISRSGRGSVLRLISGGNLGSRLGFRGTEDLGDGLSAVFRLEQGVNIDDGTLAQGGRGFGREASVGLSSRTWGTVLAGRLPTPYYVVHSTVDAFAWVGSGGLPSVVRSESASRPLLPLQTAARADNAIGYASPDWGGLQLRALGALGEGGPATGRAWSASARYAAGPFGLTLGHMRQEGANNANGRVQATVAGGSYDFGVARLFAGYTDEKNSCTTCTAGLARVTGASVSEFRLINLGARAPLGGLTTLIAQATRLQDRSRYAAPTGNRNTNWFAVGAEYNLSRRTMLYGTIGTIANHNGSRYALGSGTAAQPANAVASGDPRASTAQLGVRHLF